MAEKHIVHSSYSSHYVSTMGLGGTEATVDMSNIFNFTIYSISFPELIFLSVPKKPPDGIVSNVIMFLTIYSFFVTITLHACLRL